MKLGDEEAFDKFARRTVKVTREHTDECKRLLKLMGIPYIEAPTEAEAGMSNLMFIELLLFVLLECAALVKQGKVYGVGTEDMDVS